jgi:hypothetical protein
MLFFLFFYRYSYPKGPKFADPRLYRFILGSKWNILARKREIVVFGFPLRNGEILGTKMEMVAR